MGETSNKTKKKKRYLEDSVYSSSPSSSSSISSSESDDESSSKRHKSSRRHRHRRSSERGSSRREKEKRRERRKKKKRDRSDRDRKKGSSSRRSYREGKRKASDSDTESEKEYGLSDGDNNLPRSDPVDVVKYILQEFPAVADDLEQLLRMIDDGQAVDISGLSEKSLVKYLQKLFLSLNLNENGRLVFLLPSGVRPTLEVVGAVIRPKSGSQDPVINNHEPHNDLHSEPPKEEHKPADCGPNLPPTEDDIAAPRKRVIGPAMPSAELLAAAAKLTEAEAELREAEIGEDDALFIGPPPPAVVNEAASANEAERFEEVTRIMGAEVDNPYDIVGVNRHMAADNLKKRYWKLSLMVHPDKCPHPEAHQAFIKLNKAFKDLQDPVKRKAMDDKIDEKEEKERFKLELKAMREAAQWRRLQGISMEGDDALLADMDVKVEKTRDEWMTTLPPERKPGVATQQSTKAFSRTSREGRGDTSAWTDTPSDRAQKAKMNEMADKLKFVDSHNNAAYLSDPPANHKEFKSMVDGLKTSKISYALTANLAIYKDLVADFWLNASFRLANADTPEQIVSTVQGKNICVSEQIIREVLKIEDSLTSPSDLPLADVAEVLKRMGYEGSFPPTVKKLLPPFWRFLAHTFVICFSGRKGGADEISAASTSAIAALTMDWDYNFSRFVFNEMRSNLSSKKKDLFAMYPRFVQLIFDACHPELVRTNNSYDIKALGPNTFGLMKQVRKTSNVVFKGTEALAKFGRFAEAEGVPPTPTAIVAEEHVAPTEPVIVDDDDSMNLDISKQRYVPKEEVQALVAELQKTARKPPQAVPVIQEPPRSETDKLESEHSPLIKKRKRRDPRPGVLISEAVQMPSPNVEPTQVVSEPAPQDLDAPIIEEHVSDDEPFVPGGSSQASGSSSAQGPALGDPRYEASVRLAQYLTAQDSVRQPTQTGIHIGTGKEKESTKDFDQIISELQVEVSVLKQEVAEKDILISELDVRVSELEKEKSQQTKQISELQANLGGLTALFYDMKNKLFQKFGDEFQSSGTAAQTSTGAPESVERTPAPEVNIDQYPSSGPSSAEESREKQRKAEEHRKGKTLVIRSSDQNMPGDHPRVFITDIEKKQFVDRYGDRTGIMVWGYDAERNLFFVKRRSNNMEYYEKKTDFLSWTKVNLSELAHAPFHNPSNDRMAWTFKTFLEKRAAKNFHGMKTASSFTRKAKGVIDPHTNKQMKNVMWPPTKKLKNIPLFERFPDGILSDMQFWVYDPETSTAVIRLKKNQLRFVDSKDLLRFGEFDIKHLATFQILVTPDIFEPAAMPWTGMVAQIIEKKIWAGALTGSDVHIMELS